MEERNNMLFMKALSKYHGLYDEDIKMLKMPLSSPSYHTGIKHGMVHPVWNSLTYAVALLDSKAEAFSARAVEIIEKVVSLQDRDPSRNTYGIWPWFYEEPLEKMNPPDWNWADFCGKELLQAVIEHKNRLPGDLLGRIEQAILHAAFSIKRRDMGPHYTNIAVMGTYVTLVAGEVLHHDELYRYGKQRLKTFYAYTLHHGSFTEYNSPAYTSILIEDLTRMLGHVKDKASLAMIEELHEKAWLCLCRHFHYPTRQWAGPHARSYSSLQGAAFLSRIQLATGDKVKFLPDDDLITDISWPRHMHCPEKFAGYFQALQEPRTVKEMYLQGENDKPSEIATCYMEPEFALGTFNRSILWNQKRPFIGYFGTYRKPSYIQLRLLHDGYDYSSSVLHAVQSEGNVLGIINFLTDGGDRHCNLDLLENAGIKARDLRIRFEFGGVADALEITDKYAESNEMVCRCNGLNIRIKVPYCCFGDEGIQCEVSEGIQADKVKQALSSVSPEGGQKGDKNKNIDFILYKGEEKRFDFSEICEAVCVIGVAIEQDETSRQKEMEIETVKANGRIGAKWRANGTLLEIEAGLKPDSCNKMMMGSTSKIDGISQER